MEQHETPPGKDWSAPERYQGFREWTESHPETVAETGLDVWRSVAGYSYDEGWKRHTAYVEAQKDIDRDALEEALYQHFLNTPGGGRHPGWSRNMARHAAEGTMAFLDLG